MSVIVIGGGIAGCVVACSLQQKGLEADVYEAAPTLRPVGAGIWVPPNAMQVLDRLGLGDAVVERGIELERGEVWDARTGPLAVMDLAGSRRRFGTTTVAIHRAELQSVLVEHLVPDTLHLGMRCVQVRQTDGSVVAAFDDGSEIEGEVLVGADGIHSIVRESVVPGVTLRYSGQACYRGLARYRLPAELQRTGREMWNGAMRFGFSAIDEERIYWFAPFLAPPGAHRAGHGAKDWLRNAYASFPEPIPAIIEHTEDSDIILTDLYDFPPIQKWVQGRIVLAGDAAHAMTPNLGQGGAQAVEDGYVLGDVIARDGNLTRYERLRMPKARRLVRMSWWFGQMAHLEHPIARTLRNWVFQFTPDRVNQRQLERLYTLEY